MKVLLIGACGFLGPHVARALAPRHRLRITDVKPPPDKMKAEFAGHEFTQVDVSVAEQVRDAAEGMDAIVNLSVVRTHPVLAFQVNTVGCSHVMQAAIHWGIRRVINTGPHFAVAGPTYENLDHGVGPDAPPHPGTNLYALTKSLGQEICRAFTQAHDVYVQEYLFYNFRDAGELKPAVGGVPFVVSWRDAAEVFRLGLEVELARLPSKCEAFFILGDCPQGKFLNEKAKRILGFAPKDDVSVLWRKG
jgi:UDP-glucose 4-epimerase